MAGNKAGDGGRKISGGLICMATEYIIYHQDNGNPLEGLNRGECDPTCIFRCTISMDFMCKSLKIALLKNVPSRSLPKKCIRFIFSTSLATTY